MSDTSLENLMDKIRECNQILKTVGDQLPQAFDAFAQETQGHTTGIVLATEDVIRLRRVVDKITKQFLYTTWSPSFKSRIDDSIDGANWLLPEL